jgi:Family of unknown function (DUF6325)
MRSERPAPTWRHRAGRWHSFIDAPTRGRRVFGVTAWPDKRPGGCPVGRAQTTRDRVVRYHSAGVNHQLLEPRRRSRAAITEEPNIAEGPEQPAGGDEIRTDLVEYLIVAVPSEDALASIGSALTTLVQNAKIRILDLVVLVREADAAVTVLELEAVESMAPLRDLDIEVGGMLSEHDLELAALALKPGMPGLVLVTEDLWAKSLSTAARRAGGQIIAGERIPASRVEAALGDRGIGNT